MSAKEEEEDKKGRATGSSQSSIALVPEFLEVMDLLKNLPEATKRSTSTGATTQTASSTPNTKTTDSSKNSGSSVVTIAAVIAGDSELSTVC